MADGEAASAPLYVQNRGYSYNFGGGDRDKFTKQALEMAVGQRLLRVAECHNGISGGVFDLYFESGLCLHIDGPYDEGCDVSVHRLTVVADG